MSAMAPSAEAAPAACKKARTELVAESTSADAAPADAEVGKPAVPTVEEPVAEAPSAETAPADAEAAPAAVADAADAEAEAEADAPDDDSVWSQTSVATIETVIDPAELMPLPTSPESDCRTLFHSETWCSESWGDTPDE